MVASSSDYFKKAGISTVTTLSAPGKALAASSITVGSTVNFPLDTGIIIAIRVVDASGELVAGTYTEWSATVASGTTLTLVTTPVYGNDQVYAAGSTTQVYMPLSSYGYNKVIDGLLTSMKQTGAMIDSLPLTTPKITTSINDTNGNEVIRTPATASAVNDITVTNAVTTAAPVISASGSDTNINLNLRGKGTGKPTVGTGAVNIFPYDYIASGCVWSGDSYGSTRAASCTSGVVVINGNPLTVAAVSARTFTASRDTYCDLQDNGDGTAIWVYSESTNNAASQALTSGNVRGAIIVTGAGNIANVGSVNQGQEDKVLPIASSIPYAFTDSLGNLICPRDPNRRVLGYRQILSTVSTTTVGSDVDVTGLSVPVIVPTNRKVFISAFGPSIRSTQAPGNDMTLTVKESTTTLAQQYNHTNVSNYRLPAGVSTQLTPSPGSHTYKLTMGQTAAGTLSLEPGSTSPMYMRVELV